MLSNEQQAERCEECPLDETPSTICYNLLAYHALDLINRQKAEIERLKSDVSVSRDAYMSMTDRYDFEKEKVARAKQKCIDIAKALKTAKSEAITEYHEEVKKRCIEGGIYPAFVERVMSDVRKEMAGEQQ